MSWSQWDKIIAQYTLFSSTISQDLFNPCPWMFRPRIRMMGHPRPQFRAKADLPVGFPYRFNSSLLIHSERVSSSTSSFLAHCLAYASHASMIISKFWCHENETGSLNFGPLRKRSLSLSFCKILRSPVTTWPHGAYINSEPGQVQGRGFWERLLNSICCRLLTFVIKNFGSNWTSIAIGNAWWLLVLKVWGNITLDGFLIQNIAEIQSVDALICKFYFQEWAIFCLCVITYTDSFE